MKIDAHHHFWNYDPEEYQWIGDGMEDLKRDFGPADLEAKLKSSGIDGVISVQARTNDEENRFLLDYASKHEFIKGVVGYVDLTRADARAKLEQFSLGHEKAVGVREVLQGIEDDAYCLREDFNRGISLLHDFGLVYDILIFPRHITNATTLVDRHPDQIFILDHIAKPQIRTSTPDPNWVKHIRELGKREHVFCKISGMVTEVDKNIAWSAGLLRPYFEVVFEAFGPNRVMFGSDWPVCLLRSEYRTWVETARGLTMLLSDDEQASFWSANAIAAYGI
ncbi:MAG: amidohydrolase family protein [Verrucomicrobiales bacterium]|nr:amidohydrolase family protein [Verrucomicrobiales bacterium]